MQYAERLPIGTEDIIRNVSADVIKAFYQKWYTADNMAVILMGDISDLDSLPPLLEKHLGAVKRSSPEVPNKSLRSV